MRNTGSGWIVWLGILSMGFAMPTLSGDMVYLKGGRTVDGQILSQDAQSIEIDMAGKKTKLPMSMVERVETTGTAAKATGASADVSAAGVAPDLLAEGQRLEKAGKSDKAYEAYTRILADTTLSEAARNEIEAARNKTLEGSLTALQTEFQSLLDKKDFAGCIKQVRGRFDTVAPASFEHIALKRFESKMRMAQADCLLDQVDPQGALRVLKDGEAEGVSCPGYTAQLGAVCLEAGRPEEATRYLTDALAKDPANDPVRACLLISLESATQPALAWQVWNEKPSTFDVKEMLDDSDREGLGDCFRRHGFNELGAGRRQEARAAFQEAMALSQHTAPVLEEAARFYEQLPDSALLAEVRAEQAVMAQARANMKKDAASGDKGIVIGAASPGRSKSTIKPPTRQAASKVSKKPTSG